MKKITAKTILSIIIGGTLTSFLVMLTTLSPLAFLYFLDKFIKTGNLWNLYLSVTGFIVTIVSGLLFATMLVYLIVENLKYLGIYYTLRDLDKAINNILEQNEKQ
ncbi:MAG: hypothetical protein JHC26_06635 [Thermofilum sp.]|jgi:ABC-type thiamin/hydroxymethylpyrimidine transport system permease subunit|uniref:hypothetical protein n=1 Tax=Thermofilum sp. TaxID=1961369 RepID=UPI00258C91B9|nr:hypothetical protein [Thermofilum sp.]MCI4408750.1 hypothetical protein [Thermofilum sp.]